MQRASHIMETIDIQNRSFVVRWVKCANGETIDYQIKPLKKSIDLGIYKKLKSGLDEEVGSIHIAPDVKSVLDYANKTVLNRNSPAGSLTENGHSNHSSSSVSINSIQQHSKEKPLRERLAAAGFTQVKWIGRIEADQLYQDHLHIRDGDYFYAFILDNTASKNVKKKVLFKASTAPTISTRQTLKTRIPSSPSLVTSSRRSHKQEGGTSAIIVGQGRYLQGYLYKKRRKMLQGFTKRFFTLDFRYGTLSYYLNEYNQTRRGEIVIGLSTVSANKNHKLIIIDSGMEIWVLKAENTETWQTWVDTLQACFEKKKQENILWRKEESSRQNRQSAKPGDLTVDSSYVGEVEQYSPLPKGLYDGFKSNLKIIQQRLEQCKVDSLGYVPMSLGEGNLRRARSSSSFSGHGKSLKMAMTVSEGLDKSSKTSSGSSTPERESGNHKLYRDLEELERLLDEFSREGEILYRDHIYIAKQMREKRFSLGSYNSENDEYFDAEDNIGNGVILIDDEGDTTMSPSDAGHFIPTELGMPPLESVITIEKPEVVVAEEICEGDLFPLPISQRIRRRNDVKPASSEPPSLLSFLKKNVGKDLSSIAMPVTSNEPVSILQTISESFEYASLLQKLPSSGPVFNSLSVVSAFAVSFLSIYRDRTRALRKPFNPLLGETFELVREDMGFRLIAEKVCHRPQVFAFHADHKDWECSYSVTPVQKFWGKSIEFNNEGTLELLSKVTGELFEWAQPTTLMKNLIAGKRYLEPCNEFEVVSSMGGKATISFEKTGMFSGRSEGVTVDIMPVDPLKEKQTLVGKWTSELRDAKSQEIVWQVGDLVSDSARKYGFTVFSANLNEITPIEERNMAPTDSRLRPDIRAYENGDIAEAERLKLKLEQDQRDRRNSGKDVKPRYFEKIADGKWKFIRGPNSYWERRKRHDWADVTPLW